MSQDRALPGGSRGVPGPGPGAAGSRDPAGDDFSRRWLAERDDVAHWAAGHLGQRLRGELGAEDLLQEVACRAWQRYGRFDPERAPFHAWIRGIARNVLREALRRRSERSAALQRHGPCDPALLLAAATPLAPDPARALARDEELARFVERVGHLAETDRLLLFGRGVQGLSSAELATRLHTTPAAVSKRWQRLCRRLRRGSLDREPLEE